MFYTRKKKKNKRKFILKKNKNTQGSEQQDHCQISHWDINSPSGRRYLTPTPLLLSSLSLLVGRACSQEALKLSQLWPQNEAGISWNVFEFWKHFEISVNQLTIPDRLIIFKGCAKLSISFHSRLSQDSLRQEGWQRKLMCSHSSFLINESFHRTKHTEGIFITVLLPLYPKSQQIQLNHKSSSAAVFKKLKT